MAEILIKNMEMPKACGDCRFAVNAYGSLTEGKCAVLGYGVTYLDKRCDACPLVALPEHGRLIDADVLDKIKYTDDFYETPYIELDDILEAPTIIEAST